MKKNVFFVLLLFFVTLLSSTISDVRAVFDLDMPSFLGGGLDHEDDTPINEGGNGFASGDECGFIYGITQTYNGVQLDFTNVGDPDDGIPADSNMWQACVDLGGNFWDQGENMNSSSIAYYTATSVPNASDRSLENRLSFIGNNYEAVVDQTTGEWSGYARFFGDDFVGERWLWFDWECSIDSPCGGDDASDLRVHTNLSTGEITGYAWNDELGFISFYGLTQELPPRDIVAYVDLLASETDLGPDDVDYRSAPLADGYDYWRIRVQLLDVASGEFLTQGDIDHLNITANATADSNVYLNQVENTGDAVQDSYENDFVGCTTDTQFCVMTEADGSESFNRFIYSGAPTSNVLGENATEDAVIDYFVDRDACRWIYEEQWREVDGRMSQPPCGFLAPVYLKSDYFFQRSTSRNKYELESITIDLSLNLDREFEMTTYPETWSEGDEGPAFVEVDDSVWDYYPGEGAGDLSFRPRYQMLQFTANYDGQDYSQISSDVSKIMYLSTRASLTETSSAYQEAGGISRPDYEVYYQMDADTMIPAGVSGISNYLLIDTDKSPPSPPDSQDFEETHREDQIGSGFASYLTYERDYSIGYGQKASSCVGAVACGTATNVLSNPTAEQWVCDTAAEKRYDRKACYYTNYLPHVDRYQAPQDMLVIGVINEVINDEGILPNEEQISVMGTTETILMRNSIYAQVVRYTLGKEAGSGTLDANMMPSSGILSLMNGRLLFAKGDVVVEGSSAFSDRTLVAVGGDVYINGNIKGGKFGVVSLASQRVGGNVYVDPFVTELHANFFLDGGFYTYSETQSDTGEPTWLNDAVRMSSLRNQLYLKGSLVSRNTVNGASIEENPDLVYELGDGTSTSEYALAREHDLNFLRQFRLCYPIDPTTGLPDTTAVAELCNEGELLSEYGEENGLFNSFILEYSHPGNLPIFMTEAGLRE